MTRSILLTQQNRKVKWKQWGILDLMLSLTGADMYILNMEHFGYLTIPRDYKDMADVSRYFRNFKLKTLGKNTMEYGENQSRLLEDFPPFVNS